MAAFILFAAGITRLDGKPRHQVAHRALCALVEVDVVFFEAIVASACAGVVNDLAEVVVAEKPVEGGFHFVEVVGVGKDVIEFAEGKNGVGYIDRLLASCGYEHGFVATVHPAFV